MATIKKARTNYLYLPGKQWFYRASLLTMIMFSTALLIMSKTNNPAVARLRTNITDIVTPVLAVAASPFDAIYNAGAWVADMSRLREENIMLKNQNIELLQWQAAAKQMEVENQSLRTLLAVVPQQKNSFITVRLVSDLGGPYVHSALISGGRDNGIHKDQAVINESGLMGRVVDVGTSSARILLLNDINSRVPVIAEHSGEKSILVGNNNDLPMLSYLSAEGKIEVGERIVTSGDGGVFPPGIPVGVVVSVEKGNVKIQPFVDPTKVEYVSVIDYSL